MKSDKDWTVVANKHLYFIEKRESVNFYYESLILKAAVVVYRFVYIEQWNSIISSFLQDVSYG